MVPSQEARDAMFIPEDNRANFKDVIAKRSDLTRKAGGRLNIPGSGTVRHEAGEVLGYATSGPDAGRYKAYDNAATDGSQTAVGVLETTSDVDSDDNGSEIVIIKSGDLFEDLLIGLDAPAKVDLHANEYVEHGVNLISINA